MTLRCVPLHRAAAAIAITVLLSGACDLFTYPECTVSYRVTSTATPGTVDLTIENSGGGVSQFDDTSTPWTYSFGQVSSSTFVYVSAQNQQDHGSITAQIIADGAVWKTSTSIGAYVIATASGGINGYCE